MYSKLFVSILLAASTQVQALPTVVPRQNDYLTGLIQALNSANLTTLSTVLTQYAGTQQGQQVANSLSSGNYTVFAPSNSAFEPVLPGLQADNSTVGPILSYHIVNGSYPANSVAPARSHSIVRTLLTNSSYVNLGGNAQVQVLEQSPNGTSVLVRQTTTNATVTNTTTYQNLIIHVVDKVLTPPGDLKAVLSSSLNSRSQGGFAGLGGSLQKVGLLESLNNASSTTVLAPTDDAFAAINTTTTNLTNDQLTSILQNHVINNNVVYSTQLPSISNATAASGSQLSFSVQDGVAYVTHNQTRARILRSDVPTKTGVVYVIDTVLV